MASPNARHVIPVEIRIFRSARTLDAHVERIWEHLTQLHDVGVVNGAAGVAPESGVKARPGDSIGESQRPLYRLDRRIAATQGRESQPKLHRIRRP